MEFLKKKPHFKDVLTLCGQLGAKLDPKYSKWIKRSEIQDILTNRFARGRLFQSDFWVLCMCYSSIFPSGLNFFYQF